ncbi:acyl carrier protein [Paenibacillus sp. H1-7]|uniref:acyl carrier protein n=1 Tax=Paenibacillus sp. H1-7 TaxID=2282849 RepID=UPI001EF952B3|nr:phosphopantetheine-binding protein [Paenibacillus sp. H1-7]ULL17952.1 acyl carrier protein [Paenibacillus sp. H1-7]
MENQLLRIINKILNKKENPRGRYEALDPAASLRSDLQFDSLDLAEFTVRIEDEFGVDVFEDGNVDTIQDVLQKIARSESL